MATETLVQGEHNIADLGESLAAGFMADHVVQSLAAAELGRDLTTKKKVFQDGTKFLSQAIRDIKQARIGDEILKALIRTKREEEELPPRVDDMYIDTFQRINGFPPYYLIIPPNEAVERLKQYQSVLDNLQKGIIEPDEVRKTHRFFSHFARVMLERSREFVR